MTVGCVLGIQKGFPNLTNSSFWPSLNRLFWQMKAQHKTPHLQLRQLHSQPDLHMRRDPQVEMTLERPSRHMLWTLQKANKKLSTSEQKTITSISAIWDLTLTFKEPCEDIMRPWLLYMCTLACPSPRSIPRCLNFSSLHLSIGRSNFGNQTQRKHLFFRSNLAKSTFMTYSGLQHTRLFLQVVTLKAM